jgi:hypothetical protein
LKQSSSDAVLLAAHSSAVTAESKQQLQASHQGCGLQALLAKQLLARILQ